MVTAETIPQQAPHPDLHRLLTTSESVLNASVLDPATLPRSHDEDETRHNRAHDGCITSQPHLQTKKNMKRLILLERLILSEKKGWLSREMTICL